MTALLEIIFWASLGAAVFVYAGYPLFLRLWPGRPHRAGENEPRVSILIAAYNEESCLAATLENKLALDYPSDKLEIWVASDGSTDATDEIARRYADRGVKLLTQNPRQGKTAGLNRLAESATGEILVFSDANSLYAPDAVRRLVRNFADPRVGYVTGKMVYVDKTGSLVGAGCSAYMRYENLLRSLETAAGSVVGVDGGIDAVRKSLYAPMRADLLPDFVLPLTVVEKGFRVVYEPSALLKEDALSGSRDEWRMRVRVTLRAFHALWHKRGLFNPFRYGLFSFQLFVHKLLRYLAGFFQIAALASNVALAGQRPVYAILLAGQVVFYAGAFLGGMLERAGRSGSAGALTLPYYFCLLNGAALLAFWRFLKGDKQIVWAPRKG